ncbi:MAG: response regulator [Acidobacteria bacterium]|jgi:CheY-like chemotaxis protein|nr:response regulator [Acidobacteriota bacterium]
MKKILIVDDDRDVYESMKIVLEAEGYAVDWATNGTEAIEKAKAGKPDLMILDVMMNTDDEGFQVSYRMRQDPELLHVPIVMVTSVGTKTGFSFDRNRDQDFLPVNEFLEKPVDPKVLVDKVRENLGH